MLKTLILRADRRALRRTFGYYSLFICLGLNLAIIGPTLPALASQTGTSLEDMGLVFLAGAVGYALGTTIGGRVFDRLPGHPVLGTAQMAVAILIALIPLAPRFWSLLFLLIIKGIAEGFINTGGNTLLVWTHNERVAPYMNALHFFFGLGAFISPLLVAQFIDLPDGYRWAYWILAAFAALIGLRTLTLRDSPEPAPPIAPKAGNNRNARLYYPLILAAALYLFFYVGAEVAFGGWIYTYAVTLQVASAAGAAYLTSGFWLSFTLGRLLSIPLATRFKPKQIILGAALGCLSILTVAISLPSSGLMVWILALGLGFCMAPMWPTGFTLAGQSLQLSGRASGLILLGDSFGGMLLPWLAGVVIGVSGPQAMLYLVSGSLVLNLLAFGGMLRLRAT
jgi:FHS family Na+ dependent glucose MFS transporter 1